MRSMKLTVFALVFAATLAFGGISRQDTGVTAANAHGRSCIPSVLLHRLNQIRRKFGPIRVISTYRPGARVRGTGRPSLHASCRAVDFHPPRGKYRAVAAWLKKVHNGGVGTYSCRMHHIHIDNGPRVRFHKCIR